MLVACVRAIRGITGGIGLDALFDALNSPALNTRFQDCFGQALPENFFALTARQTLTLCGLQVVDGAYHLNEIDAPYSERRLENLLINEESNEAACIALAAMLLYQVIVRYQQRMPPSFNNWYRQQVHNDVSDISIPGVLQFLHNDLGDNWLDKNNCEILKRVLSRFVIRQHERMSYERGFGGGAPLFNIDGTTVIGTGVDFTDPRAFNGRLGSAIQILIDLGLVARDDDLGYLRMPEGDAWLTAELHSLGAI